MGQNYIYQTIHTLSHTALYVAEHCRILERSCIDIFLRPLALDAEKIKGDIERLLRDSNAPTELSFFVELRVDCDCRLDIVLLDASIYCGYELRTFAPRATCVTFSSPFGLHSSSARRSTLDFARDVAKSIGYDVAIECDRARKSSGGYLDRVLSVNGYAAFGFIGKSLIASTAFVGVGSVERDLILSAARECGYDVVERDLLVDELLRLDELFYCDHCGVTALASFHSPDRNRIYNNSKSGQIAAALTQPW